MAGIPNQAGIQHHFQVDLQLPATIKAKSPQFICLNFSIYASYSTWQLPIQELFASDITFSSRTVIL